MEKLNVITDCPTGWNSTYYMLERFGKIRQAIIAALLSDELNKKKNEFTYLFSILILNSHYNHIQRHNDTKQSL